LKKKSFIYLSFLLAGIFLISLSSAFYLSLPDVKSLQKQNPKKTSLIEFRKTDAKKGGKTINIKMQWVSFKEIPDLLKHSIRITEDASFYWHKGIDFEEIKEALKKNIKMKRLARGGSTITQQLAKNLYLSPKKSIFRKIKEICIARRLEKSLSKDRIFELYLNVIELGPGIFGVGAASKHYFNRKPSELSLEEIVRLTAIIPRPLKEKPTGSSRWLKWRCAWILHKLRLYKYISDEEYKQTLSSFN